MVVAWFRADNETRSVLTPNRFLLEVMGALLGALPDIRKDKTTPVSSLHYLNTPASETATNILLASIQVGCFILLLVGPPGSQANWSVS